MMEGGNEENTFLGNSLQKANSKFALENPIFLELMKFPFWVSTYLFSGGKLLVSGR